jgi:hypothetical protein
MEKLIEDIVKRGIPVKIFYDSTHDNIVYCIDGFYKSDTINLYKTSTGKWECAARYNEINIVESFDDLVHINYVWWIRSRDRYEGWQEPHGYWKQHLIDMKLVTVEPHTHFEYKPTHKL